MDNISSAQPNTEKGTSQGAQPCRTYISSRFAFCVTASWGAQPHNMVVLNRFAFRSIASWGTRIHNAVVSGGYNHHCIAEVVKWRPPLLFANPLGHGLVATLDM